MTKIAEKEQIIIAYSYDSKDFHLVGSFEYHWAIGTGLAAQSTNIKPPSFSASKIPIFNEDQQKWSIVDDYRLQMAYSTTDKMEVRIDYVGELKDGFTLSKPDTQFDVWNGQYWIDPRTEEEKLAYKRSQYPKLTRYQFMRGLLEMGFKSSDIEAQILLIEDEFTRELTMIDFKDATNFVRTGISIDVMRDLLGKTDEEIDEFWELCVTF